MPAQAAQDRHNAVDQGSDSGEDGYDEEPQMDPKGKKRGSNPQAARRDQNRIAQREFRLRKQQRIRDLELRVEVLSANKDEAFISLEGMLQDLVRENAALRQLVKDLSSFIGEGIGGFLPKLGWDIGTFEEFKNRAETDSMAESYQARKKNPNVPAPGVVPVLAGQKRRAAPDELPNSSRKKSRLSPLETEPNGSSSNAFPPGQAHNTSIYTNPQASVSSAPSNNGYGREFDNAAQAGGSSGANNYLSSFSAIPAQAPGGATTGYPSSRPAVAPPPPINTSNLPGVPNYHQNSSTATNAPHQFSNHRVNATSESSTPSLVTSVSYNDEIQHNRRDEMGRLIHHHLSSYKRNPAYCLPAALRPTHVQRTVSHEFIIDGIIFSDVRDKMILYKGSYDLADAVHVLYSTAIIHSDDLLTVSNWEVHEEWFVKFGFLATKSVLDLTNKWRRERNDPEIPLTVIEERGASFDA